MVIIYANSSYGAQYWARTYGVEDSWDDGSFIQQTTDGGYIMVGYTHSFGAGSSDIWVLKLDSNGNVTWQKTYGGSNTDSAKSIQQTKDGGFIMAGYTTSFGAGNYDVWVLKLDSNGNVTWQKTYGGSGSETAHYIQQTEDGGYIAACYTDFFGAGSGDILVLKLDSNGNVTWQKTYGGSGTDDAHSIQQISDEGYILAGNTTTPGDQDFWVLRLDSNGNVTWQKTYGGSNHDRAFSFQQTKDGGSVMAGHTRSFGAGENSDFWVLKLDNSGNIFWQKRYGNTLEHATSIQLTTDGGYVVVGNTYSIGDMHDDFWVLKLDSTGNVSWQKIYGESGIEDAHSIQQISDGGYIVVGDTNSFGASDIDFDLWVLKLGSNGEIPNCDIISTSDATVFDTSIIGQDSSATITFPSVTITDTNIIPLDTSAEITTICSCIDSDDDGIPDDEDNCPYDPENDIDNDGICGDIDNCSDTPNGPNLGNCIKILDGVVVSYRVGDPQSFITCTTNADCTDTGGTCQMEQGDYNDNGCGDVCECYMDCDNGGAGDGKVIGSDLGVLKGEYGRFDCSELDPCYADGNEDGKVNGSDLGLLKNEYGRFDCPECP